MSDLHSQEKIDEAWKLFEETSARFREIDARRDKRFQEAGLFRREYQDRNPATLPLVGTVCRFPLQPVVFGNAASS